MSVEDSETARVEPFGVIGSKGGRSTSGGGSR